KLARRCLQVAHISHCAFTAVTTEFEPNSADVQIAPHLAPQQTICHSTGILHKDFGLMTVSETNAAASRTGEPDCHPISSRRQTLLTHRVLQVTRNHDHLSYTYDRGFVHEYSAGLLRAVQVLQVAAEQVADSLQTGVGQHARCKRTSGTILHRP